MLLPAGQAFAFEFATTGWYPWRTVLGGVAESLAVIAKLNDPGVVGVPVIVTVFVVVCIVFGSVVVPLLRSKPGGSTPVTTLHV